MKVRIKPIVSHRVGNQWYIGYAMYAANGLCEYKEYSLGRKGITAEGVYEMPDKDWRLE